jgi:ATP-binding cassette, subfamily B, heavy metal transporter
MFSRLKKTLSDITPYIFSKAHSGRITGGLVLTSVGMTLDFLEPYLLGETVAILISATTPEGSTTTTIMGNTFSPLALIGTAGVIHYTRQLISNLRSDVVAPLGPVATKDLVLRYSDHVLKQTSNYHATTKYSDHITRIQKCYMSMYSVTTQFYNQILPTTLGVGVGAGILAESYNSLVALSLVGAVVIYTGYNVATKKMVTDARDIAVESGFQSFEDTNRTLTFAETSQLFNNERYEQKRLVRSIIKNTKDEINAAAKINHAGKGQDIILSAGSLTLNLLAGNAVLNYHLRPQDYVVIYSYLKQFFDPLGSFGMSVNQLVSGFTDLENVFDHLRTSQEVINYYPEKKLTLLKSSPLIEFKNVNFSYDEKTPLLKNVSFTARAGKKTALVGGSGAGKSTIGNLIYRFYDPALSSDSTSGIFIDGQNIKYVDLNSLRLIIGIIQQKPVLFNDTIYNNIAYGGICHTKCGDINEVDIKEIQSVAQKACLADVIDSFPKKYETEVGERGAKLSGGQSQRLAIARVLLKRPKILICDEATSALDGITEKEIQANIDAVAKDKTMIVIAHHLSTIMDADNIAVFDNGKVIEQGTHDQLLANKGKYFTLWESQTKKTTLPGADEKPSEVAPTSGLLVSTADLKSTAEPVKNSALSEEPKSTNVVINIAPAGLSTGH